MNISCALLALIDAARRDLYVACTGDCRAVAGVWEEDETGKGVWKVEVLSEDQTGRNPKELRRCAQTNVPFSILRFGVTGYSLNTRMMNREQSYNVVVF